LYRVQYAVGAKVASFNYLGNEACYSCVRKRVRQIWLPSE